MQRWALAVAGILVALTAILVVLRAAGGIPTAASPTPTLVVPCTPPPVPPDPAVEPPRSPTGALFELVHVRSAGGPVTITAHGMTFDGVYNAGSGMIDFLITLRPHTVNALVLHFTRPHLVVAGPGGCGSYYAYTGGAAASLTTDRTRRPLLIVQRAAP